MRAIAGAVLATAPPVADGVVLEVGAGTGEIGAAVASAGGMAYLGLDLSLSMLARFAARLRALPAAAARAAIAQADADCPWPLGPRARVVFISRALHLLDLDHAAAEIRSCAHPRGCSVVVGRVRREPESVRGMLRRQMRSLLAAEGLTGKSGERAQGRLLAALSPFGGNSREPITAAEWTAQVRPADVIASWRGKAGLAGVAVPAELQGEILDRLEAWAGARLGDLTAPHPSAEAYELTIVDLPARQEVSL